MKTKKSLIDKIKQVADSGCKLRDAHHHVGIETKIIRAIAKEHGIRFHGKKTLETKKGETPIDKFLKRPLTNV